MLQVNGLACVRSQVGMNGQNVFFSLEVTFIFTLDFEIVPAVWGFIFVSIVK
jgi:hypothetical protein